MTTPSSELFIFDQQLIEERKYWIARLSNMNKHAYLEPDFLQSSEHGSKQEMISIGLTGTPYQHLLRMTSHNSFLIYTVLMTTLMICLSKYSTNSLCCIGSPAHKLQENVHCLPNILAIVAEIDPTISFRDCLLHVRQALLDAYARQRYPFERLLKDLQKDKQSSSFFDIILLLTDLHQDLPQANQNITVAFSRTSEELKGKILYNTNLYQRSSIERFASRFLMVLHQGLQDPHTLISQLKMQTENERKHVLFACKRTQTPYPEQLCVHQLFEAQVERTPAALAVMDHQQSLTYQELNRRANQLAHALRQVGVGPEVPVALLLERSAELVIALLAVLKAGGAYLPLDVEAPAERLALILKQAHIPILVSQQAQQAQLLASDAHLVLLESEGSRIAEQSQQNLSAGVSPAHLAYIMYTSGSTGRPKGVMVTHRNLVNYSCFISALLTRQQQEESAPLHFATGSSLSTDLGNTALFPSLLTGGCFHMLRHETVTDGKQFARYVREHPVDVLKIVPSHLLALLSAGEPTACLPRHCLVLGGEEFTPDLLKRLASSGGSCQFLNHYGPTETTVGSLTYRVPVSEQASWKPARVPIGRPIANTEVYILNEQMEPLPLGMAGELYIGGAGVARGYYQQPGETAERFVPHPFSQEPGARLYQTGDRARCLPDGQIEFLGRMDQQVKIRGYRVEPREIEVVLDQHPNIQASIVVTKDDTFNNKQLRAYIVSDRKSLLTAEALRDFLKRKLPAYLIPSEFIVLENLPLMSNGKVDRQKLSKIEGQRLKSKSIYEAPRTKLEQVVTKIWQEVLGIEEAGIHDNFFELGGHSLLLVRVHSKLKDVSGRDLSIVDLFKYPTIESIARFLSND